MYRPVIVESPRFLTKGVIQCNCESQLILHFTSFDEYLKEWVIAIKVWIISESFIN